MIQFLPDTPYNHYENYDLDIPSYELSKTELQSLDNAILLVDNKWSLRRLSKEVCRSKSQLHRDMHNLRKISYDLYKCVIKVLESHKC